MSKEESKIENSVYAFILGREQKIALAELEAVLRRFGFDFCEYDPKPKDEKYNNEDPLIRSNNHNCTILSLQDNIVFIKMSLEAIGSREFAKEIMEQLGGTVKIFEIQNAQITDPNQGIETLAIDNLAHDKSSGTLNFGISDYSGGHSVKHLNEMGIGIKIQARKRRPVRYIANKETELSSATSFHKIWKTGGEEFGVFKNPKTDNLLLGRLVATSNPDEWSDRDYGKPAGDKFSGMMPPKLARILVNLAIGQMEMTKSKGRMSNILPKDTNPNSSSVITHSDLRPLVIDPFCGSGNILMEALILGCDIIGSDISGKAVDDTKINLEWLCSNSRFKIQNLNLVENCKLNIDNSVFKVDATCPDFVSELKNRTTGKQKKVVIVTEPYLGKPKKSKVESRILRIEVKELKKLYLSFFENLTSADKGASQSRGYQLEAICFVFPLIETLDSGTISLYDECIDDLYKMGYNPIRTLRYGRDYQIVKREIAVFNHQ